MWCSYLCFSCTCDWCFKFHRVFQYISKKICCLWSKWAFFFPNQTQLHSSSSCSTIAIGAIWSSWLLGLGSHPISRPSDAFFRERWGSNRRIGGSCIGSFLGVATYEEIFRWKSVICLEYQGNLPGSRLTMHQKERKGVIILCNLLLSMLSPHPLCNPQPRTVTRPWPPP